MTLIINGFDFSEYVQSEFEEVPEYADGAAAGVNILGQPIFDRVGTRYKKVVDLMPLPASKFNQLKQACEANTAQITITTSEGDLPYTAQLRLLRYSYKMSVGGERIFSGATLEVETL